MEAPPRDWAEADAYRIAQNIRRIRGPQGLDISAQRVADRCYELQVPITRAVIADLESGRRRFVSTTEVITLAEALGVSPFELLYGDEGGEIEVMPTRWRSREQAQLWFCGMDDAGLRISRGKVAASLKEAREAAEKFLRMTSGGFED